MGFVSTQPVGTYHGERKHGRVHVHAHVHLRVRSCMRRQMCMHVHVPMYMHMHIDMRLRACIRACAWASAGMHDTSCTAWMPA